MNKAKKINAQQYAHKTDFFSSLAYFFAGIFNSLLIQNDSTANISQKHLLANQYRAKHLLIASISNQYRDIYIEQIIY